MGDLKVQPPDRSNDRTRTSSIFYQNSMSALGLVLRQQRTWLATAEIVANTTSSFSYSIYFIDAQILLGSGIVKAPNLLIIRLVSD